MIKKLRKRFILTSMLSVLIVLVIIMGTSNILNFRSGIRDADQVLSLL